MSAKLFEKLQVIPNGSIANRMHENDHLNGVLHIDRAKGKDRKEIEPALKQIKQKYYLKKS